MIGIIGLVLGCRRILRRANGPGHWQILSRVGLGDAVEA